MAEVAFLFAGQGAQKVGMGLAYCEFSSGAKEVFATAERSLGYDLAAVVREGPESRLAETEITQPAILAASLATARALAEEGVVPDAAAGLSLGEYGALVVAGSLDEEAAFPLVRDRGRFMQEAVPLGEGGMIAVLGLTSGEVEEIAASLPAGYVAVANYNCPGQVVVAGDRPGLAAFREAAAARAKRLVDLAVSAPFHCALLEPAGRALADRLGGIELLPASFPVVANVTALPMPAEPAEMKDILSRQVFQPVRFEESLAWMLSQGVDTFIEVGPGTSLGGFVRRLDRSATVYATDTVEGFGEVVSALGRKKIS